jgi:hypothetical protein
MSYLNIPFWKFKLKRKQYILFKQNLVCINMYWLVNDW